jgi:hypothetical protein
VSTRKRPLSKQEIASAFAAGEPVPRILSPGQLARFLGLPLKTIYDWLARGRFDGAFRKRGKHVLFWRDRAIAAIFNERDWTDA